jgi:hypothetical protein
MNFAYLGGHFIQIALRIQVAFGSVAGGWYFRNDLFLEMANSLHCVASTQAPLLGVVKGAPQIRHQKFPGGAAESTTRVAPVDVIDASWLTVVFLDFASVGIFPKLT